MGCSCEMMKFQRKVDVPSITGGGKVQINHLISPAFSPLSWGSCAREKSIKLHKWDMTQRSLCLYTGLCTYLTLALTLCYNSGQLQPEHGWTSSHEMQKHPAKIPQSSKTEESGLWGQSPEEKLEITLDVFVRLLVFQQYTKTSDLISTKFGGEMGNGPKENPLNLCGGSGQKISFPLSH